MIRIPLFVPLLLMSGAVLADDLASREPAGQPVGEAVGERVSAPVAKPTVAKTAEGEKVISGMSILGNQEAPKSLVIVPWKSSEIGASLGLSAMLDDSRQPVDRDVFMRELEYYQLRSNSN